MSSRIPFSLLIPILLLAWVLGISSATAQVPAPPKVKLVVLVVFDQLRGDFLTKWNGEFGDDGFRRLYREGLWFQDCRYPFASTATGPGHASMLTGAAPSKTGIVNNEWYDRETGDEVYCAGNTKYQLVPAPKPPADASKQPAKPKPTGSPEQLLCETVADVLKARTQGKSKVFGLSLKDRSGILPSGKKPDGVFWFNSQFVTSSYYAEALPDWVKQFNAKGKAESYFGKPWQRMSKTIDYEKLAGPDQVEGEGDLNGQGVVFPHPTTGADRKTKQLFTDIKVAGAGYYDALANSPFGNELLLDFAKTCIDSEKLGQHDTPDLLTVSFSSNDLIGHTWGPDSQEVLDVSLRSDLIVADLLKHLDQQVGMGNYAVVLTADHGVCPLPEVSARKGLDAKRISAKSLLQKAETYLDDTYKVKDTKTEEPNKTDSKPNSRWIEASKAPNLYLNHKFIKSQSLQVEEVVAKLAAWLRKEEGLLRVYTSRELKKNEIKPDDQIGELVMKSFQLERSGDLYLVLKPYYLVNDGYPTGTNHGTPHDYDRHVPLICFGPTIRRGISLEAVTPLHAAAIAANLLGVSAPKDAQYDVPLTLWK